MDSVVEEEKVDMNPFELAEFCSWFEVISSCNKVYLFLTIYHII